MTWAEEASRLALIELWATGVLRRRVSQADAWDDLAMLPWTRRTGRRDELVLDEAHRGDIEALLDRCFPAWRQALSELARHQLPSDLHGWKRLQELQRETSLPPNLPAQLNLRTATAALAAHSKATLSERLRRVLGEVETTRDGIVRLRPSSGLIVARGADRRSAHELAMLLGEVTLTERALLGGTRLEGVSPRAILLVENVGFYVDVAPPEGWLTAHVPGWNTATVDLLLDQFPSVPTVHFGDLDPNGVRIFAHLQSFRPNLRWAVPTFWEEHIATRGQRLAWPEDLDLDGAPALVRRLVVEGIWLEQEPLALDPRIPAFLDELITADTPFE